MTCSWLWSIIIDHSGAWKLWATIYFESKMEEEDLQARENKWQKSNSTTS